MWYDGKALAQFVRVVILLSLHIIIEYLLQEYLWLCLLIEGFDTEHWRIMLDGKECSEGSAPTLSG